MTRPVYEDLGPGDEALLIASVLSHPGTVTTARTIVADATAFPTIEMRKLWPLVEQLAEEGRLHPDALAARIEAAKLAEPGQGTFWLASQGVLTAMRPEATETYAAKVARAHRADRLGILIEKWQHDLEVTSVLEIDDMIDAVKLQLAALGNTDAGRMPEGVSASDLADQALTTIEEHAHHGVQPKLSTGLVNVNVLLEGGLWASGEFVTLAGRPGLGKTTLAMEIQRLCGLRSAMFHLEMNAEQVGQHWLRALGEVPLQALYNNGPKYRQRLNQQVISRGGETPATSYFIPSARLTLNVLEAVIRRDMARDGTKLFIIDNVTLMAESLARTSRVKSWEATSQATAALKALVNDTGAVIVAIQHLNRNVDRRDGDIPRLDDLRGAGEQDADTVLVLSHDRNDEASGRVIFKVTVRKTRGRQTRDRSMPLAYLPKTDRVEDQPSGEQS